LWWAKIAISFTWPNGNCLSVLIGFFLKMRLNQLILCALEKTVPMPTSASQAIPNLPKLVFPKVEKLAACFTGLKLTRSLRIKTF
jgi:hypothetical protein